MVTIMQLTDNLKSYISSQLESMSKSSPVIGFMKPLITRALDKNFSKITKALELIADKDGNVDVEGILTEMMENLMTTNPFSFKTSFIGDIEIGGGQIKFNLPLTNKRLVLNMSDLEAFKETLITKIRSMDELMMYEYLNRRGMGGMSESEFRNKFRDFMKRYRRDSMEHDGFMSLEDRNYPRRHEDDGFMDVFDSRSNRFGDRFRDSGMRGNDMDRIIKYMRHSMNDGEHFTESEAMDLVSDMYHTEGGRKYSGEKFDIHKAKEICERYRGVIPVSATPTDVYVAINSQYHDYVELFKSWFGDNVDQKIIESAIIFWFKDVDCKSRNKVVSYFKEY